MTNKFHNDVSVVELVSLSQRINKALSPSGQFNGDKAGILSQSEDFIKESMTRIVGAAVMMASANGGDPHGEMAKLECIAAAKSAIDAIRAFGIAAVNDCERIAEANTGPVAEG